MKKTLARLQDLLKGSGVTVNGPNAWDILIDESNVEKFYYRVIADGSLGLGESYMKGWWHCKQIDEMICRLLKAGLDVRHEKNLPNLLLYLRAKLFNLQNKERGKSNAESHYNIGNDIYRPMLGKTWSYTCGYWKDAKNLDEAQNAKNDLANRKLYLSPKMSILDIGCGWGAYLRRTNETHPDALLYGLTNSSEQVAEAKKHGHIFMDDYRNINGIYNRIVSMGMFEHVGPKNHRQFMEVAHMHLKTEGLFLLHTITGNKSQKTGDPWINKYIFPGAVIPSIAQITKATKGLFVIEDIHDFGPDYDKTLMAWLKNFERAWHHLRGKYEDEFYRMWTYYLASCAGSFRARKNNLSQIILSKKPVEKYISVR